MTQKKNIVLKVYLHKPVYHRILKKKKKTEGQNEFDGLL